MVPLFDSARAEAAVVDTARACGETLGPLAGLPFTVKESFDVAGTPATLGLPSRARHRATADAIYIAKMRSAGAILLGKTNVPQFLMGNKSSNAIYGRTNNPWNPERSPGGSSGGEAALIAARGSVLGLGADIGGSIRLPAHACGIHGLKPTSARLQEPARADLFGGQDAIMIQSGPMARHVADLELALKFLSAKKYIDSGNVRLERLRIAMYTDNGVITVAPALRRAVREAAAALRDRGATVEEWEPPDMPEAWRLYMAILMSDGMAWARHSVRWREIDPSLRQLFVAGLFPRWLVTGISRPFFRMIGQHHYANLAGTTGYITESEYRGLVHAAERYRERFLVAFTHRFDAILCPPAATPAIRHDGENPADTLSYPALYNLLGMPAGVVAATRVRLNEESDRPASQDWMERAARYSEEGSAGLPVGVQVAAAHWRDDIVLRIMSALEEHFRRIEGYPAGPLSSLPPPTHPARRPLG